ncbi:DUF4883 family protein [Clostridium sp.]|uniref:DUF4883 family protein n=1 Tax=Clostridium sp. TaxID=1506 RepID=UPI003217884C
MKKKFLILFIIIITITTGCTNIKLSPNAEKTCLNYYTQELVNNLNKTEPIRISVFYKEFFKEFDFPSTESKDIISFLNSLNESYFIEKPDDLPESYKYKVYIEFPNEKYGITIFNEKYISIYGWDGKYEVDYLNITEVPTSYNLYGICKYFTEK